MFGRCGLVRCSLAAQQLRPRDLDAGSRGRVSGEESHVDSPAKHRRKCCCVGGYTGLVHNPAVALGKAQRYHSLTEIGLRSGVRHQYLCSFGIGFVAGGVLTARRSRSRGCVGTRARRMAAPKWIGRWTGVVSVGVEPRTHLPSSTRLRAPFPQGGTRSETPPLSQRERFDASSPVRASVPTPRGSLAS